MHDGAMKCEQCQKHLELCFCNAESGIYSVEPYIRKSSKKNLLSSEGFNTVFYKLLATHPLHSPTNILNNVGGYFRSSDFGAMGGFQSVPVIPGARQLDVIGSRFNTSKLNGLDFSHEGLSMHVTQLNDIYFQRNKEEDYTDNLIFKMHGKAFESSTIKEEIRSSNGKAPEERKSIEALREYHSSTSIIQDSEIEFKDSLAWAKFAGQNQILTDAKLEDNNATCESVMKNLADKNLKYLAVSHENDYPCLGVIFATPDNINNNDCTSQWMQLMMSIYLGICDYRYHAENGPLKVWVKTSFGHMETTISDCLDVMRINVGMLVEEQIDALVDSLQELDDLLRELYEDADVEKSDTFTVKYDAPLDLFTLEINKDGYGKPNTRHVDGLSKNNSYYHGYAFRYIRLRCKKAKNILFSILTDRKSLANEKDNTPEIYNENQEKYIYHLIKKIKKIYGWDLSRVDKHLQNYPTVIQTLRYCLGANVYNNYIAPNHMLEDDGYGSGSEEESEIESVKIYSEKFSFPFAMRAINIALYLQQLVENINVNKTEKDQMYYETSNTKNRYYKPDLSKTISVKKKSNKKPIILKDANHLPNTYLARKKSLDLDDADVIDITSSTTEQVGKLVYRHLIELKKDIIFFVSSLTKNEFGGSDSVGIGMLRVFTRNKELAVLIRKNIEDKAQSKPSGYANMMRRGYKKTYGMLQNRQILNAAATNAIGSISPSVPSKTKGVKRRQEQAVEKSADQNFDGFSSAYKRSRLESPITRLQYEIPTQSISKAIIDFDRSGNDFSEAAQAQSEYNGAGIGGGNKQKMLDIVINEEEWLKSKNENGQIIENSSDGDCWYESILQGYGIENCNKMYVQKLRKKIAEKIVSSHNADPENSPITSTILSLCNGEELKFYLKNPDRFSQWADEWVTTNILTPKAWVMEWANSAWVKIYFKTIIMIYDFETDNIRYYSFAHPEGITLKPQIEGFELIKLLYTNGHYRAILS